MSIFDFLFARAATPEQAQKNIFLDAIDGGGRFGSGDDFRGGPLGISALLNALGVDPYGSTNAQPQAKPQGQAFAPRPPTGPARSLRPQPRPTQQMPDELLTERFGTQFALGTPSEVTTSALPSAAPSIPAHLAGTKMGMLPMVSQVAQDAAPLNLLNAQVEAAMRDSETNYFDTAVKYPDFFPFVQANANSGLSTEQLARKFLKIPEGTASPLAMSAAPTVPNDAPTSDNPNRHPETAIQNFMSEYGLSRQGAIGALDISLRAYEAQKEMREATQ